MALLIDAGIYTATVRAQNQPHQVPVLASINSQPVNTYTSTTPNGQNALKADISPRSIGTTQVDSTGLNSQVSKMTIRPEASKLPALTRKSSKFIRPFWAKIVNLISYHDSPRPMGIKETRL